MDRRDQRSEQAAAWRRLYKTARWQRIRAEQLGKHPLCAYCLKTKRLTPATVCDHVDPKTKGTEVGFFAGPFQSLCKTHHDATKQREEHAGHAVGCDTQGRPLDKRHPWNQHA